MIPAVTMDVWGPTLHAVTFDHDLRLPDGWVSVSVEAEADIDQAAATLLEVVCAETQEPVRLTAEGRRELECRAIQVATERAEGG